MSSFTRAPDLFRRFCGEKLTSKNVPGGENRSGRLEMSIVTNGLRPRDNKKSGGRQK